MKEVGKVLGTICKIILFIPFAFFCFVSGLVAGSKR